MIILTAISLAAALFIPPVDWEAAQPKGLFSVKVGFVGPSDQPFKPSISLVSEKVHCNLKEYVKSVRKIYLDRPGTEWRDLGVIEMRAGMGRLTEIRTADTVTLQAIYLGDEMAYILTAAVAKKDFPIVQKELIKAFKSLYLTSDLWEELKEEAIREKIASLIEEKEWKSLQQLIEKETSSMGKYWQFLALQEAYEKIFSK